MVEAAKLLGLNRIPVVVLNHLDEAQLRAYAVAANKLADVAGYDELELSLELADIRQLLGDLEFPELGIETPELDRLLGLADLSKAKRTSSPPPIADKQSASREMCGGSVSTGSCAAMRSLRQAMPPL